MIEPIDPNISGQGLLLSISDTEGGRLSLHASKGLAGIVVSDKDAPVPAACHLSRADRAALIAALIALQEDESIE